MGQKAKMWWKSETLGYDWFANALASGFASLELEL